MDVGIAYYLYPHDPLHSDAWVSINAERHMKITNPLSNTDVLWLTNLELSAMIEWGIDDRLVKRNDFLPGGLLGVFKDLGISMKQVARDGIGVQTVCELMMRCIQFLQDRNLVDRIESLQRLGDIARHFVSKTMNSSNSDQLYHQAFIDSFKQQFRNTDPSILSNGERIQFKFPKGAYALHLANRPLPAGAWREIDIDREVPVREQLRVLAGSVTGFARVRVSRNHTAELSLLSAGDPTGQWIVLPEAYELSKQIPIKVDTAIASDEVIHPLNSLIDIASSGSHAGLLTFSAGIVLESCWQTLASQRLYRTDNTHSFPTAQSSYLRAWDRIACYRASRILQGDGCEIISYGNGQVSAVIPDHLYESKIIEAYELGLTANLDVFTQKRRIAEAASAAVSMTV